MSSAAFRFEDCTLVVESAAASDLRWLAAFLDCGFQESFELRGDYVVKLVVDEPAYERLRRAGRRAGAAPVAGFAGDAGSRRFEPWSSDDADRVFRDAQQPIFYRVSEGGADVELVAREAFPKLRTALMRVVRELVMGRIVASGGTLIHGAAVSTEAGVVVMCGPKRSGKTTLLLALLRSQAAEYVSNDRCLLRVDEGRLHVRGLPTLVSIRSETLDHFPDLRERLSRVRPDLAALEASGRSKFSLSPPQLCELMGAGRRSGGPLRAFVFPRMEAGSRSPSLRRLTAAETLARFDRGLFRADADTLLGDVFVSDLGPARLRASRDVAPRVRGAIAQTVACFECEMGGGAPPDSRQCRELMQAIAGHAEASPREDRPHV